jgi:hypothetical protein
MLEILTSHNLGLALWNFRGSFAFRLEAATR